jgi:hypothetical protein
MKNPRIDTYTHFFASDGPKLGLAYNFENVKVVLHSQFQTTWQIRGLHKTYQRMTKDELTSGADLSPKSLGVKKFADLYLHITFFSVSPK